MTPTPPTFSGGGESDGRFPERPGWSPPAGHFPGAPAPRPPVPSSTIFGLVLGVVILGGLSFAALLVCILGVERVHLGDAAKILIALTAAALSLADVGRAALRGRVPEPLKMALGITLGLAAILAYFNGFSFGYPKFYHRWEQYHAYVGAKYFPELGYDNLYR